MGCKICLVHIRLSLCFRRDCADLGDFHRRVVLSEGLAVCMGKHWTVCSFDCWTDYILSHIHIEVVSYAGWGVRHEP